ncbi:hypothetical protein DINM_006540 [Dirofilaria immitis]|nr:hypothetical protein [Dirofilaria immitis]
MVHRIHRNAFYRGTWLVIDSEGSLRVFVFNQRLSAGEGGENVRAPQRQPPVFALIVVYIFSCSNAFDLSTASACKQMRKVWDKNATIKQNMKAMGLAYDSNKLFSLCPNASKYCEEIEQKLRDSTKFQIQKAKSIGSESKAIKVIAALEKEEMSRDARNIYQDTSKQIERKIRIFKQSPEYSTYLKLMSQAA